MAHGAVDVDAESMDSMGSEGAAGARSEPGAVVLIGTGALGDCCATAQRTTPTSIMHAQRAKVKFRGGARVALGVCATVAKEAPAGPDFLQRAFICLSSFRSPHLLLPLLPLASPPSPPRAPTPTMPVSRDPQDRDPLAAALRPPIDETEEEKASRIAEEEAARRVSHAIDEAIRQEKQQRKKQKLVRLLLLGQSESGPFRPSRRLPVPYINL